MPRQLHPRVSAGVHIAGVMKVQGVCARVDIEEVRVDRGEVAGGGEAVAEEGGELSAADDREAPQPVNLESSGLADGRGGLPRDELEEGDGLKCRPSLTYRPIPTRS